MENLVNVYFFGKKYQVPESLTIMKAMEYAGYQLVRGCGCRNGFCGACSTIYRIKGDRELHACLACQTKVENDMYVATLPFFPLVKEGYDIENIPNYTNSDQKVKLENTLSTYVTQFADPKNMLFVISEPVLMEFQSQVDYEVVQDKLLLNGTPVEKLFIQYSGQHFEENIYLICRNISGQIANKKNVRCV